MIYWAAVGELNGQSWLEGFSVGDEGVAKVLDVASTQLKVSRDQGGQLQKGTGAVQCIGCHTAVPDGKSVAFVDDWPWSGVAASVANMHEGEVPVLAHARRRRGVQPAVARDHELLARPPGTPTITRWS